MTTVRQHVRTLTCLSWLLTLSAIADTISDDYPNDIGIGLHPDVLLHENFQQGWEQWDSPRSDTRHLNIVQHSEHAGGGRNYLRSSVSLDDLLDRDTISATSRHTLKRPVDELFWRFYVRFEGDAPTPHHWVRFAASQGEFDMRGKANTLPAGDAAFWGAVDIGLGDRPYFYLYWHAMRSGRCNDGTAEPGCEGDQGETYYYGNKLRSETGERLERDRWHCIEIHAKANRPGESDGELALYVDDRLQMHYRTGSPEGTWLRDSFHIGGCDYESCGDVAAFEGLELRTHPRVQFRQLFLSAYNQKNTFTRRLERLRSVDPGVSEHQRIHYADIVAATSRVGCRRELASEHQSSEN